MWLFLFWQVIDINDNVLEFIMLIYEEMIKEEIKVGEKVVQVFVMDLDSFKIQDLLVYLIDKIGQRYFLINFEIGQIIIVNEKFDCEKDLIVSFYVFVYDGKYRGEVLVRVNLIDINDNVLYFLNFFYVGYVEENKNLGISVMVF